MQADPGFNIPIYSYSLAGIVLAPWANRLICSYPYDVGSLNRRCWPRGVTDHCIPGCSRWDNDNDVWCAPGTIQRDRTIPPHHPLVATALRHLPPDNPVVDVGL